MVARRLAGKSHARELMRDALYRVSRNPAETESVVTAMILEMRRLPTPWLAPVAHDLLDVVAHEIDAAVFEAMCAELTKEEILEVPGLRNLTPEAYDLAIKRIWEKLSKDHAF